MADLLSVETVAEYLGIADPSDDRNLLDRLINAAKRAFEDIAHRTLDTNTAYTEYHDAGGRYIYVDRPPISEVSTLKDGVQDSARSISTDDWISDSDDQGKNYRAGKIELWQGESHFTGTRLDVEATYNGGWTATNIPQDLREAWIELVAFWFNNTERVGVSSIAADGQSVSYTAENVPLSIAKVFRRYSIARNY